MVRSREYRSREYTFLFGIQVRRRIYLGDCLGSIDDRRIPIDDVYDIKDIKVAGLEDDRIRIRFPSFRDTIDRVDAIKRNVPNLSAENFRDGDLPVTGSSFELNVISISFPAVISVTLPLASVNDTSPSVTLSV